MITQTLLGSTIVLDPGMLADAGPRIVERAPAHRYVVISDDTVRSLPVFGQIVTSLERSGGPGVIAADVPSGEASKTRQQWARLSDWMLRERCGRDTTIVALGGGVVGDLAGFVAATFMRGIPVVQVPTTLLAMVDASIGGKTGVDTPAGKNLIGAFHRPHLVLLDPSVLATLPPDHVRGGLAEVLKHGAIADSAYFEQAATASRTLRQVRPEEALTWWSGLDAASLVWRSVEIKTSFVARDERESGPREALNFGHTVAHAIERATRYAVPHGDAVAVGMVAEATMGEQAGATVDGTAGRLAQALRAAGLPVQLTTEVSIEALVRAATTDKKSRRGSIRFSCPQALGTFQPRNGAWSLPASESLLRDGLAAIRNASSPLGVRQP